MRYSAPKKKFLTFQVNTIDEFILFIQEFLKLLSTCTFMYAFLDWIIGDLQIDKEIVYFCA
jgi:hypothetical protein